MMVPSLAVVHPATLRNDLLTCLAIFGPADS
jgi:hypothetical protein